jgi:hypothetical protein
MRLRLGFLGASAVLLGCLAVVPVDAGAAGSAPSAPGVPSVCGLDGVARDAWYPVARPGNGGSWSMGQVGDDPCVLVAASPGGDVSRSADGGRSWTLVAHHAAGLGKVLSEGLGGRVLIAEKTGGGVLVSTDGGRTFARKALISGLPAAVDAAGQVIGAAGDGLVVIVLRVGGLVDGTQVRRPGPSLFLSTNGGASFSAIAASATLSPVAVAYDYVADTILVADDGVYPQGGVWRSADGGSTFQQLIAIRGMTDIVVSAYPGGGRVIYAAGTTGVWDSVDGGGGWGADGKSAVYKLRPEWGAPGVVNALFASPDIRPGRSPDSGKTFYLKDAGVPLDCRGDAMQRTTNVPSFFLLGCADGRTYRFVSDGADFTLAVPPAGGPPGPGGTPGGGASPLYGQPTPMHPVRSWPLKNVAKESGSIAFDGAILYYGDIGKPDPDECCGDTTFSPKVQRMIGRTGQLLPPINAGANVFALDVDRDRHSLFVQDGAWTKPGAMYSNSLLGGKAAHMFKIDGQHGPYGVAYSWDPTLQAFWTFDEGASTIYLVSRQGELISTCDYGGQGAGFFVSLGGSAAIAAAGDGTAYVEMEDDSTVARVTRKCGVAAVFEHPTYSEVIAENDAITCDTNSFSESAIWLRDGNLRTATAYAVPGGYCPLPTRISVTGPARLPLAATGLVCASLKLPWNIPVTGVDVTLYADSMPLGVGRTDAAGKVCATYVPSVDHRPLVDPVGRKEIRAVFLGNKSYRPSNAIGGLTVLPGPLPLAKIPHVGAAAAPVEPAPPLPQQPLPQPAPHVQAATRQVQTQAQAQAQAQPVTQANPNAVIVAQQQEQPQLAYVTEAHSEQIADVYEMSARPRGRDPMAPFGLAACAVTMAAGFAFAVRTAKVRAR